MKIFVEGGGGSAALRTECRRAFSTLLHKALAQRPGCRLRLDIVVAGSRGEAYRKFYAELRTGNTQVLLLVDSETVVTNLNAGGQTLDPWQHLLGSDQWQRPAGATNDQAHLMAVTMETWLVADVGALAAYYGTGLAVSQLPQRRQLEQEPKLQLNTKLKAATHSSTKGAYRKGSPHDHSFTLLQQLDPAVLETRLPHAERLFKYLRSQC